MRSPAAEAPWPRRASCRWGTPVRAHVRARVLARMAAQARSADDRKQALALALDGVPVLAQEKGEQRWRALE
eukprot:9565711-Lingulodinium_polyedra.AAC.1